jgi:DNA polymerase-3 subunit delta
MTPDELRRELGAGTLRSAYLVAGEEALLRDDAVGAISAAVLAGADADWNLDRLDGAATTPAALLDAARTLPVMAERRLLVLRHPEEARGAALADALADLLPELAAGSRSVLVVVAARVDSRARWVKAFGDARVVCEAPQRARELAAFVREEGSRQGVSFERGAAELLAERVGPQLLMLRQEIAKAALVAGADGVVTRAAIERLGADVAEQPIWDLTDAIGEGRGGDALYLLERLLAAGAPAPVVLASLASHFRRLLRLRSGGRVAGPPFVQRKLESQARRYAERRLVGALRAIHQTDLALKGEGGLRPALALERLVIGLSA